MGGRGRGGGGGGDWGSGIRVLGSLGRRRLGRLVRGLGEGRKEEAWSWSLLALLWRARGEREKKRRADEEPKLMMCHYGLEEDEMGCKTKVMINQRRG